MAGTEDIKRGVKRKRDIVGSSYSCGSLHLPGMIIQDDIARKLRTKLVSEQSHNSILSTAHGISPQHHELKEAKKVGKKAKTFETRKIVKRLKDAR